MLVKDDQCKKATVVVTVEVGGKRISVSGDAWAVLARVAGAGLWITQEWSRQVSRGDVSGASEGIQRDVTHCH